MVNLPPVDYCPDCGGKLLYNGAALVCIRCPYAMPKPDSHKSIPVARPPAAADPDKN